MITPPMQKQFGAFGHTPSPPLQGSFRTGVAGQRMLEAPPLPPLEGAPLAPPLEVPPLEVPPLEVPPEPPLPALTQVTLPA
jgi:hypothetical protein